MPKRDRDFPMLLTLGAGMLVKTGNRQAKCTVKQINRTNLTAAGDGVKVKIHRNGDEEFTVSVEVEDADGRKKLVE